MGNDFIGPLNISYDEIPFYQQRWFLMLLIIFFQPALILIGFSGNIYALRDGDVYKFKSPWVFGFMGIITSVLMYFTFFQ